LPATIPFTALSTAIFSGHAERKIALPEHLVRGGHPDKAMQFSGDHPHQISVEVFFRHFALLALDLEPYQVRQCNKKGRPVAC
jgi:hypothetical protein